MEKVGGSVVGLDGVASRSIELDGRGTSNFQRRTFNFQLVSSGCTNFLGPGDGVAVEGSDVAFLAAHFGEEDGFVGNDEEGVVLLVDFEDGGFAGIGIEAEEFRDLSLIHI